MNNKENVAINNSEQKDLMSEVVLPMKAFRFLGNDRNYNNPSRLSKIQAFIDLAQYSLQCRKEGKETALNISNLAKRWNWTRPTVLAYVNSLKDMDVLLVEDSKEGKRVSLVSKVLPGTMCCGESSCEQSGRSSQPPSPLPHISSSETNNKGVKA